MAKQRYKFQSSFALKKAHKEMMTKNFSVRDVSVSKTKSGEHSVFFTVKSSKEETRIQNHFDKIGISLEKV